MDRDTFEKFVRVMARFSIAGMVAHLSGTVSNELGPELVEKMLHEEGLPLDTASPEKSRALLRVHGKLLFAESWAREIKKAADVLPPVHREEALKHFTSMRAWRQIMY